MLAVKKAKSLLRLLKCKELTSFAYLGFSYWLVKKWTFAFFIPKRMLSRQPQVEERHSYLHSLDLPTRFKRRRLAQLLTLEDRGDSLLLYGIYIFVRWDSIDEIADADPTNRERNSCLRANINYTAGIWLFYWFSLPYRHCYPASLNRSCWSEILW